MKKGLKIIISCLLVIQLLPLNIVFSNQTSLLYHSNMIIDNHAEDRAFDEFHSYIDNIDASTDELTELALDRLDEFAETVDEIFGEEDESISSNTFPPRNVNRPFPQSGNNPLPRERRLPTNFAAAPGNNPGIQSDLTAQEQMDFDTLTRFNNILFAFVVDPDPETRYDPDNFRMVLAMPRHSWVTINPAGSYDPVHGNMAGVRHLGIMVCESQGFGMLMLPLMAGAENEMVPDIRANRGGTGTGAGAFPERTVTLGQNLFNNLPEGLQDALRDRYGEETDSVDIQFYFDAMFRTVRQFPSFEILEDGTVPYPRQAEHPHEGGVGRRTYLMSWELSTGIPGIDSPGNISIATWIDGYRTGPGTTTGNPIGNANAAFNWFLAYGQPFYDARNINQSHSIATDGNMDIIMGLIYAHYQWGGGGRGGIDFDFNQVPSEQSVGYMYWAQGMLQDFWYTVVDRTEQAHLDMGWEGNYHLRVGNWSIHEDAYFNDLGVWMSNATRASDHIFHHLRTFDYLDPVNDWGKVIEATYEAQRQLALLRYPNVNGILPDFAYLDREAGTWHPAPTTGGGWLEGNSDGTYSWNNLRVPWRFGTDLMMSNRNPVDNLILGNLHRHVNTTWPNFTGIRSMTLDGVGASPASGTGVGFWAPFIIPAAMTDDIGIDQDWFNLAWSHTRRQAQANNFYADYFKVLSMIVASGNYWTPVDVPVTPSSYRALHVRNGYGSGMFAPGTEVEITARSLPGYRFVEWVIPSGVTIVRGNVHSQNITVLVPNDEVIISATFVENVPEAIYMYRLGRTRFLVGEELDTTGMYISVVYETETRQVAVTSEMVTGFDSSSLGEVTLTITYNGLTTELVVTIGRELRPFPQVGQDTGRVVDLYRPTAVSQDEMNADILRAFADIIVGEPWSGEITGHPSESFLATVNSQFIIDPATIDTPDALRMLIFLDHGTGGTATTAVSRRVTVSESMGYGMLMLVQLAGSEDIPFEHNGSITTVRELLYEALPQELQEYFGMENVDTRLFFDAMFRSLRHWPTHPQHVTGGHHAWGANHNNNAYRGLPAPNNFRPSYLMAWSIHYNSNINGFIRESGPSNATDGCMDMAYALLLAGEQWGHAPVWHPTEATGTPIYSYHEWAVRMINDIFLQNVHHSSNNISNANPRPGANYHITSGNWQSGNGAFTTRPSDHMFQHLKAFRDVNPENDWQRVIDVLYDATIEIAMLQYPNVTGIIPDFIRWGHTAHTVGGDQIEVGRWNVPRQGTGSTEGYPHNPPPGAMNHQWMPHAYRTPYSTWVAGAQWHESPSDGARHWNACRVPWRQGVDILFSGMTPIADVVTRTYNDFQFEVTGGQFNQVAGRWLNGELNQTHLHARFNHPNYLNSGSAFWGSSAIPAAVFGPQEWFDDAWNVLVEDHFWNNQYGDFIKLLTMYSMSGNDWTPVGNPVTVYNGTIIDGLTSGRRFVASASIPLRADDIEGMTFSHWEVEGAEFWDGFDAYTPNTYIEMPQNAVVARAIFVIATCPAIAYGQFANQRDGIAGSEWRLCEDGTLEIDEGFINWTLYQGPWATYVDEITDVVITGQVTAGTSLRSLFRDFQVTEIEGLTYLDTSLTRNMENMFRNANALVELDLSSFDTSNITNMQRMFTNTHSLMELTLGNQFNFDANAGLPVRGVTDEFTGLWQNDEFVFTSAQLMNQFNGATMAGTFVWQVWEVDICEVVARGRFAHQAGADGIAGAPWHLCEDGTLEIGEGFINWVIYQGPWHAYRDEITYIVITGPVTAGPSLRSLFRDLAYVTEIEGLDYFDTTLTTSMENMFRTSTGIVRLDLSSFDSRNVTNMHRMFTNMHGLNELIIGEHFTIADNAGLPAHLRP